MKPPVVLQRIVRPLVVVAGLILAGCASEATEATETAPATIAVTSAPTTTAEPTTTTTPPTTTAAPTTTIDPLVADTALIKTLYRAYSDAWLEGPQAGRQFIADHNYPGFYSTIDELDACLTDIVSDEAIVDATTIEATPGWMLPPSDPLGGTALDGTIYIATVEFRTTFDDGGTDTFTSEVHTAILNGAAYFFIGC